MVLAIQWDKNHEFYNSEIAEPLNENEALDALRVTQSDDYDAFDLSNLTPEDQALIKKFNEFGDILFNDKDNADLVAKNAPKREDYPEGQFGNLYYQAYLTMYKQQLVSQYFGQRNGYDKARR